MNSFAEIIFDHLTNLKSLGVSSQFLIRRIFAACSIGILVFYQLSLAETIVFSTNFDSGAPAQFSGITTTESVQSYAGLGPTGNQFGGNFLRNGSGWYSQRVPTTLTLTGLPVHSSVSIKFLLAIIDSWDGNDSPVASWCPDFFNVAVDDVNIFSETFSNSFNNFVQSYIPPSGVLLTPRPFPELGWNVWGTCGDSAYKMGADPIFQKIPHSSSTLKISWFANGRGYEGGNGESWAIDNVEVSVSSPSPAGSGTISDPYRIRSLAEFDTFAADSNYWNGYTRLETDVNLAGRTYTRAVIAPSMSSTGAFQGTWFTGTFDGNGKKISNLRIDTGGAENSFLGLFGWVQGSSAQIKNLGVVNVSINGGPTSSNIGGVCGYNDGIALNNGATISNCYVTGSIVCGTASAKVGGLCGTNCGTVSNCWSNSSVTGHYGVGGLCGETNQTGQFWYCYSTGIVTGDEYKGGFCGQNYGAVLHGCFWDTQASAISTSAGGTGPNTAQMKTLSTFTSAGWDFSNVWGIANGQTYPYLKMLTGIDPADLNYDHHVNFLDFAIFTNNWLNE